MVVGILLITSLEPYASELFLPKPIDGAIALTWRFVQLATLYCLGEDVSAFLQRRTQEWRRSC